MRLVTYRSRRGIRAGALAGGESVIDAADALGEREASVRSLLAGGRLEQLAAALHSPGAHAVPLADVELLPPVPDPEKIVCIGLNYRSHAEEAGIEPSAQPTFFGKYRNALVGHDAAVALPEASEKVDFEAEVAVVVGGRLADAAPAEALAGIAGYMLFNDLSARDLQFATPQWMPGKTFDGSAPCGPALVTVDEAGAHDDISFTLELNGERMQEASTGELIFPIPDVVSHLSRLMTLEPGDVIATGTPAGVGSTRRPRVWLRPGDRVVISSPELGELATTIR